MVETKDADLLQEQVLHKVTKEEGEEMELDSQVRESLDETLSVEEQIDLLVEELFAPAPLQLAAPAGDNFKELARTAASGLETTGKVIKEVSDAAKTGKKVLEIIKITGTVFKSLSGVFSAGKAAYDLYKFIDNFGKPSEFDQMMDQMREIKEQLEKVETAIQQGFADLIAHVDFADFRKEVAKPTEILFKAYLRCFTVSSEIPINEFKEDRDRYRPRNILSTISTILNGRGNIFATQLKADKYVYSTFKTWMDTVLNHSIQLITVNLFYYGLVAAESPEKEKQMEEFAKSEMKALFSDMTVMAERMNQIDCERIQSAIATNTCTEWVKTTFDKVKRNNPVGNGELPQNFLPGLARDFRELWKEMNGPQDFCVIISRGKHQNLKFSATNAVETSEIMPSGGNIARYMQYDIADNAKVIVVPDIIDWGNGDGLNLVVIQPFTKKILEANRLSPADGEELRKKLPIFITDLKIKEIRDRVNKLDSRKPLFILYNEDMEIGPMNERYLRDPQVRDKAYEYVGEAWCIDAEAGLPNTKKIDWNTMDGQRGSSKLYTLKNHKLMVIFQ